MSDETFAERIARLEERMKTMQAEYKTDIALLAQQMKTDVSRVAEDAAKREARQTVIFVGVVAAATAILGVLIGVQN